MKRLRELVRRLLANPATRRLLAGASMATASLLCSVAAAAGGGHEPSNGHGAPHLNWWTWDVDAPPVGWFFVDVFIFVGLLVYMTRKPVAEMFKKRHETIKAAINESQAALASAKAHHDEYRDKLLRVEEDVTALVDGAKDDGRAEKQRIIAGARDYSSQLRTDTDAVVVQEIEAAHLRLREEVVAEILRNAHNTIVAELTDSDRNRLLEEAIDDLEDGSGHFQSLEARSTV